MRRIARGSGFKENLPWGGGAEPPAGAGGSAQRVVPGARKVYFFGQ